MKTAASWVAKRAAERAESLVESWVAGTAVRWASRLVAQWGGLTVELMVDS